jgi:hypothetical protein
MVASLVIGHFPGRYEALGSIPNTYTHTHTHTNEAVRGVLIQYDWQPYQSKKFGQRDSREAHTHTHTQEKGHMRTQ